MDLLEKKIADKIVKPKPIIDESSRNVEEIVTQKTIQEILNKLRQVLLSIEHHKIFKFLNDSAVSRFVARKWVEVNDLLNGQYFINKSIRFKYQCYYQYQ